MIISKLVGGLGNQMFQYAAGRTLASRLGSDLFLDLSYYNRQPPSDTPRCYELDCFLTAVKEAATNQTNTITSLYDETSLFRKILNKITRMTQQAEWIRESRCKHLPSEVLSCRSKNVLLDGYWMSESYFSESESTIRKDFSFKNKTGKTINPWIEKIQSVNAISLHIRRGDYANNPRTLAFHGLLPLSYYKKAMGYIGKKCKTPTFFVFSDDLHWAKENLRSDFPMEFVSHQGKDYEDMRLMSLCKHHIIANSSFSWWGAWLNPSKDKIVVAPNKWFANSQKSAADIVPKSWIKL